MSWFTRGVLLATHNPVSRRLFTGTRAGRALAHRFVAGDTLDDGIAAARRLAEAGMLTSLDLLGEEVTDRPSALDARDEYREVLDRLAETSLPANISIKLTQLGLAIDEEMARQAVDELAVRAAEVGTTVTIDMEDSRFTAATVEIYADAQARHGNLGIALQAYLHRTPDDLERLIPLGGHIRLCKGAYAEPPEIALQTRAEVTAAFSSLLEILMEAEETRPAIATHDETLIEQTRELACRRRGGFEFQMLYGVRPELQRRLRDEGYDLRIYVPFGSQWYPYLTRRLAERPANLVFFARSLVGRDRAGSV